MKFLKLFAIVFVLLVFFFRLDAECIGPGLVTGDSARDWFESKQTEDCWMYLDFENFPTGLYTTLEKYNIDLATTEIRWPLPEVQAPKNTPVAILPYDYVTSPNHRLMGVNRTKIPDGQSKYDITFPYPLLAVGLNRIWNTYSITRFFNESNKLLESHTNTKNHEFVGYIAEGYSTMIHRVEFDGLPSDPDSDKNKLYQVGEVDDLFYADSSLMAEIKFDTVKVVIGTELKPEIIITNLGNYSQDNIGIQILFWSHVQKRDIEINLKRNFKPNEKKTFNYILPITYQKDGYIKVNLISPSGKIIYKISKEYEVFYPIQFITIPNLLLLLPEIPKED